MPRLALALREVKKEQAGHSKRSQLPITPAILHKIWHVWSSEPSKWNHVMLWAACCLGFFGFLRSREFTAPEDGEFDLGQHLSFSGIAADSLLDPKVLSIHIKQSKTTKKGYYTVGCGLGGMTASWGQLRDPPFHPPSVRVKGG